MKAWHDSPYLLGLSFFNLNSPHRECIYSMPQTLPRNSPALGIEFEGDNLWYQPGNVIIGRVVRTCQTECSQAILTVSLNGRAKSKYREGRSEYRGRFPLIVGQRNKQELFKGPVHVERGQCRSWPFTFTLPTYTDSRSAPMSVKENEKFSFVPFTDDVPLPASFAGASTSGKEAFIEYYVQADMQLHAHGSVTAMKPFRVVCYNPGPPLQTRMNLLNTLHNVEGEDLVPGYSKDELTTSQKFKKLFSSAPPPKFGFTLQIWVPIALQLDQAGHVPIKLRVVPKRDNTSEILQGVLHACRLQTLNLEIQTIVRTRNQGMFNPHDVDWKWRASVGDSRRLHQLRTPIDIPFGQDSDPLDIGELLALKMQTTKERKEKLDLNFQQLYPEFTTYNIRTRHMMKGTIGIKVANKLITAEIKRDIKILPPNDPTDVPAGPTIDENAGAGSSTWIEPPPAYEEPPRFEELEGEALRERDVHRNTGESGNVAPSTIFRPAPGPQ